MNMLVKLFMKRNMEYRRVFTSLRVIFLWNLHAHDFWKVLHNMCFKLTFMFWFEKENHLIKTKSMH